MARADVGGDPPPGESPEQRARRRTTAATPLRERANTDVYQAISQHRYVANIARERHLTERMDVARHQALRRSRRGLR